MLTVLLILSSLIWFPILFHQITHRGLVVLLIWLLIAPVATNLVQGDTNPLFESYTEASESSNTLSAKEWRNKRQDIKVWELIEPTRLLFVLFVVTLFLGILLRKRRGLALDRTEICMAVFSVILVANIFMQSERLPYSLRNAIDGFMVPFFAYYVGRRLVITEDGFFRLTRFLGYLGVYLIIIGIMERLTYPGLIHRLSGPFDSGTAYYYVMMVPFFAVLLSAICNRSGREEKGALHPGIQWFVLCLTPVIILLTWSRGNWVGFLMGAWVFLFLGYRLIIRSRKMALAGILLLLVPIMVISFQAVVPGELIEGRILTTHTVEWRLARWDVAIQEAAQHPIFGVGFKNLQDILGSRLGSAYSVHNFFLSSLAELGLVGLLAYLAIIASVIGKGMTLYRGNMYSQDCWRGVAIIAVMVAHLIPAFFSNTIQSTAVMLVYVYAFVGGITGLYSSRKVVPVSDYRLPHSMAPVPSR